MTTSYTSNLRLQKPARADRTWDVPLNADLDQLDGCTAIGGLAVIANETPSTSLNVRVSAGKFIQQAGTIASYGGTSGLAIAASSTVYLWLNDAGTLVTGGSFPGTPYIPLAVVVSGATTLTSVTDARVPYRTAGTGSGSASSGAAFLLVGTDSSLTNERSLVGTTNQIAFTDGGANGNYTASIPTTFIPPGTLAPVGVTTTAGRKIGGKVVSAAYTVLPADEYLSVNASGGAVTITLLATSTSPWQQVRIRKSDSGGNSVTISGPIEGGSSIALTTQTSNRVFVANNTTSVWEPN